jgi:hypothetical protein
MDCLAPETATRPRFPSVHATPQAMPNTRDRIPPSRRRGRAGWAALPLLIACGGHDPATQVDRAGSWAATTRELAIERGVGAIGRSYTADLLDAGRRDVQKIVQSLDPSQLPERTRARAPAAVRQLDTLMMRTADAVRRGDVVALGTAAASADALGDTLRALHAELASK